MIRAHVICEGQTEEEFVRHLLSPTFLRHQVSLLPSCIGKVGHKVGNLNLNRLSIDVRERLLKDRQCYCTTLFDYYGLPSDFPGKSEGSAFHDIADKQAHIVHALSRWSASSLGSHPASRFIPYVQMHGLREKWDKFQNFYLKKDD